MLKHAIVAAMLIAAGGNVAAVQENEYEHPVATVTRSSSSPQTVIVYQTCCYAFGDSWGLIVRDGEGRTKIQTELGTDVSVSCLSHWYCAAFVFDGKPIVARKMIIVTRSGAFEYDGIWVGVLGVIANARRHWIFHSLTVGLLLFPLMVKKALRAWSSYVRPWLMIVLAMAVSFVAAPLWCLSAAFGSASLITTLVLATLVLPAFYGKRRRTITHRA